MSPIAIAVEDAMCNAHAGAELHHVATGIWTDVTCRAFHLGRGHRALRETVCSQALGVASRHRNVWFSP